MMRVRARILLAVLAALALAPVVGNDFIGFDDHVYVTENPHVAGGLTLEGVRWALWTPRAPNWVPLSFISHMIDVELFGLAPWGHHLTSLLIHVLNALLLAAVLTRLTGREWPSLAVAALFAVHPLRVESVAWVAERKDVLCAFFGLLALWLYARWARNGRRWRLALLYVAFAASLASKPMLVTLPFLALLLDFWPLGRLHSLRDAVRLAIEKIPMFLIAGLGVVMAVIAQREAGTMAAVAVVPPGLRLANAAVAVWRYVGKLFWPLGLSPLYHLVAWPAAVVAAAVAGLVVVTVLVLTQLRARPYLTVGWLWFLGTLLPVIGLVQIGRQSMADRYTYLPTIGLLIALVWGVAELLEHLAPQTRRAVGIAALGAALVALTTLTVHQAALWRDSVTLFGHAVAVEPGNSDCWRLLGAGLLQRSGPAAALPALRRAVELAPRDPVGRFALGAALESAGQPATAAAEYEEATRLVPGYPEAAVALAWIRATSPEPSLRDGHAALAALAQVSPADRVGRADVLDAMAAALAESGRFPEAVAAAEAALRVAGPAERRGIAARLEGYRDGRPFRRAPAFVVR